MTTKTLTKLAQAAIDTLRAAAEIIGDEEHWCQGAWGACGIDEAISNDKLVGLECEVRGMGPEHHYAQANSPEAIRWCAEGAIYKAAKGRLRSIGGAQLGKRCIQLVDRVIYDSDVESSGGIRLSDLVGMNDDDGRASRERCAQQMVETADQLEDGAITL